MIQTVRSGSETMPRLELLHEQIPGAKPQEIAQWVREGFRKILAILDRQPIQVAHEPSAASAVRQTRRAAQRGFDLTGELVRAMRSAQSQGFR